MALRWTVLLPFAVLMSLLLHARPAYAGYTHYWEWHARPEPDALRACVADMNRIVESKREMLADREDRPRGAALFVGRSRFGDAGDPLPDIVFNGIGNDAHEPFGFPLVPGMPGDPSFQFVKTAAKPYDEVVTACLIVARDHFPPDVLGISSDGYWVDWAAGAALYEHVLGRKARNPLEGTSDLEAQESPGDGGAGSLRKNVTISAIFFLALAIGYYLMVRSER